ncbi:MAG: DUF4342 domain-containing protein [Lachnospiraceae bacterium]|nr:DUF4342 domain-containing protein [Lachnospiraceae bacterium]
MEKLEKVEKLREKTGVSYEEAKGALEACEYDMLDALIYLEKLGKVSAPKMSSYTTTSDDRTSEEFAVAQKTYENDCKGTSVGDAFNKFFDWCGRVIRKGCETSFNVTKEGKNVMSIPVILLVLALIFLLPLTVLLLVIGLFTNCHYYFEGFESTTIDINNVCEKASEACDNLKNDFKKNDNN